MLDVFHIATPQGCNIQTFYGSALDSQPKQSWSKPRGISNIYMLAIGPGGDGDGSSGGGTGAVTVWYGSAKNVPDNLVISVGSSSVPTIIYQRNSGGLTTLIRANPASTSGGSATTENQFAASGFYQSIAGQAGVAGAVSASSTTFLQAGGTGASATSNYGYSTTTVGYFQFQPIIVGVGSVGVNTNRAAFGCGGGGVSAVTGLGGPGMVLIASW